MSDEKIVSRIKEQFQDRVPELTNPAPRRIFVRIDRSNLLAVTRFLRDTFNFVHVSTISGVDKGEVFEILYHLANESCLLTVRTTTPRNEPKVPSICEVIPGAVLYERELQDMFGLIIENIPDPRPLVLPDDWPQGQHPLRKDWIFERPEEKIPGGG